MDVKKVQFLRKLLPLIAWANVLSVHAQAGGAVVYSNPTVEQADAYVNGNVYQRDLLLFLDLLQSTHPAFAAGENTPFDMDRTTQEGYLWAADCESVVALQTYLQQTAARLGDGHTGVIIDRNADLIYPCGVFIDGRIVYLQGADTTYASFVGSEIVGINEHPVWDVVNSFRTTMSFDNEPCFLSRVNGIVQSHAMWEQNPYSRPDSSLLLTFADGRDLVLHPISPRNIQIVWAQSETPVEVVVKPTKAPFAYTLLPDKKMCYLFFNTCADQHTLRAQMSASYPDGIPVQVEQRLAQIPKFDLFLDEMFREIEVGGITTLVVDVRYNQGGNSQLCDALLSRLKPTSKLKDFDTSIRFSPLWELHYRQLAEAYRKAFAEKGMTFDADLLYSGSRLSGILAASDASLRQKSDTLTSKSKDGKNRFKGAVIFVQGAKTYSSAGMLITKAVDNRIGLVIGENSSYRPSHYGDLLTWELPNTQIKGTISHKRFHRPDRSKDQETLLRPDVAISPTWEGVKSGADPFQDWIFSH